MLSFHTFRRGAAFLLAVSLLFSAAACQRVPKSTKEESAAVLAIDEFSVPYEQLRYVVRNYMDGYGDESFWTEETAAQYADTVLADSLDALKIQYAILSLAKQYGIERTDEAIAELVDSQMEAVIAEYGSTAAYADALAARHMTDSVYRFFLSVGVCSEELYYAMMDAGELETDTAVIEEIIRGEEFVRVKQILIENDEGENPAENLALAEDLRARAAAGEDFDTLVNEYGEDLHMFKNTDGYYICRGVWYHAFEDTAFSLKVGEVSDVIETEAGYSILLRCEKEAAYIEKNLAALCEDYRDACFSLKIEERAAELTLTTNENFDRYTILTME